ncbi:MAG: hypothetical protein HKL80_03125 [Acidimicrobiales bacterium]|nr:hypothetical protein [Acidimicrobiales bacterium]
MANYGLYIIFGLMVIIGVVDQVALVTYKKKYGSSISPQNSGSNSYISKLWFESIRLSISSPSNFSSWAARRTVIGPIGTFCILYVKGIFTGRSQVLSDSRDTFESRVKKNTYGEWHDLQSTTLEMNTFPNTDSPSNVSQEPVPAQLNPPPTQEEYHEALLNPWPGHTPEETIQRNRDKST